MLVVHGEAQRVAGEVHGQHRTRRCSHDARSQAVGCLGPRLVGAHLRPIDHDVHADSMTRTRPVRQAGWMLHNVIPKVFYEDVEVGIDLFVDGIGMEVLHRDEDLVVVARDGAKVYLVEDAEFAAKDRPELGIETDDIESIHHEISARRPDLLHPNLPEVRLREWGAREFALRDSSDVCVVFRSWT